MGFVDIVNSQDFINAPNLSFVIGQDKNRNIILGDLKKEPHYLIGGRAASGKTNMLFSMVLSLLLKNKSNELKLILANGKEVNEFEVFEKIEQVKVINDYETFNYVLKYLVNEMELRYSMFMNEKVVNIDEYNKLENVRKLPNIVLIMDEMEGLCRDCGMDENYMIENLICALLQKARASGIHVVMSSQSASRYPVNMICNFVGRIIFNSHENEYRHFTDVRITDELEERGKCAYKQSYSNEMKFVKCPLVDINTIQELMKVK